MLGLDALGDRIERQALRDREDRGADGLIVGARIEIGEFIEVLPPMKRVSEKWYQGTADAVYQNIYSIGSEQPKHVLILSGDHIYKMNYGLMLSGTTTRAPTSPWPPS